jgi:4-hydroxybenzoyl-CoA reductase subunit beta
MAVWYGNAPIVIPKLFKQRTLQPPFFINKGHFEIPSRRLLSPMRLPNFTYLEPETLGDVLSLLKDLQGEARVLAGGTDLLTLMKYGLAAPSTLISLKRVTTLKGIDLRDIEVFIGAATTLAELRVSPVIRKYFPALHQAVEAVAAPPIWNVGTIGGNLVQETRCLYYNQSKAWRLERPPCFKAGGRICHAVPKGNKCFSVYCGDLAPALIALEGRLSIESKDQMNVIPLTDLFSGNGLTPFHLTRDSLISGVIIPLPEKNSGSSYEKFRLRGAVDYPLVSAAVSITFQKGGKIKKAALVLGAVGPKPVMVDTDQLYPELTHDLINREAIEQLLGKKAPLVDNLAMPGSYRKKLLPIVALRAIRRAEESLPERSVHE